MRLRLATLQGTYLAGVEMSINLDDDLIVFIRCLLSRDHHLSCCQVLQLIHLRTQLSVTSRMSNS